MAGASARAVLYQHRNLHHPGHGAEEFQRKQAVKFLVESLKGTKKQDMVADSRIVQNTHEAFKGVPCRAWVDFWPLEDNLAEVQEEE